MKQPQLNDLIQKYNRPAPRYTSYPPVPYWINSPSEENWIKQIKTSYHCHQGLDLYVHVPYCERLCYYCGCSRTITKDHSVEGHYMNLILKEWDLYKEKLGFTPAVNSLHFGGGTPTFLSPENLDRLISHLTENKLPDFIGSIEIDPRTCQTAHLKVLAAHGVKRVSLGIQDFDPIVQKTINRMQPVEMVELLLEKIRSHHIPSINFDLIYGLPKQTLQSIADTISIVSHMRPDLIAFYSYAHLPEKIKNQRLIANEDLPTPELKRELYEMGKKLLLENGYVDVGMDHFALPSSYLYQAKLKNELHRNFMGYVDKKSPVLLGLGPTSISDSSLSFAQNAKEMKDYEELIKQGSLPIEKGHTHSAADLEVQKLILELMCQNRVSLQNTQIPYLNEVKKELAQFADDGIISLSGPEIEITPLGRAFVRNVAMAFDFHFREQKSAVRFSQAI